MELRPDMKVVCVCFRGQVRSVAARNILVERYGFKKVLACGWHTNDDETLQMLYQWADAILVVGRGLDWNLETPPEKTVMLNVGRDEWHRYDHRDLRRLLIPMIEELVCLTPYSTL